MKFMHNILHFSLTVITKTYTWIIMNNLNLYSAQWSPPGLCYSLLGFKFIRLCLSLKFFDQWMWNNKNGASDNDYNYNLLLKFKINLAVSKYSPKTRMFWIHYQNLFAVRKHFWKSFRCQTFFWIFIFVRSDLWRKEGVNVIFVPSNFHITWRNNY